MKAFVISAFLVGLLSVGYHLITGHSFWMVFTTPLTATLILVISGLLGIGIDYLIKKN